MIQLSVRIYRLSVACYELVVAVIRLGHLRLRILRIRLMECRIEATNRHVRRIMARQQRRKAAMQQWIDRL